MFVGEGVRRPLSDKEVVFGVKIPWSRTRANLKRLLRVVAFSEVVTALIVIKAKL